MFRVEIINLKTYAVIGISDKERKKKQLLKVNLSFNYSVLKNKDLNDINNLKDYSLIIFFVKKYINQSRYKTLEKLITETSKVISKKFELKNISVKINKTEVAKKYGSESLSVSN